MRRTLRRRGEGRTAWLGPEIYFIVRYQCFRVSTIQRFHGSTFDASTPAQQQLPASQQVLFPSVFALYSCPFVSFACRSDVREQSNGLASVSGISTSGSTNSNKSRYGGF